MATKWIAGAWCAAVLVVLAAAEGSAAPVATASSGRATARFACDGDPGTVWTSAAADGAPRLDVDLGEARDVAAIVLTWVPGAHARDYTLETSADGRAWTAPRIVAGANGGRDVVDVPAARARFVRLRVTRPASAAGTVALAELGVRDAAWCDGPGGVAGAIARESARGAWPRAWLGEPVACAAVAVEHDSLRGAIDGDGRIAGPGGFTLEPFVREDGRLVTWAGVTHSLALADGDLPIPTAEWAWGDERLAITAIAAGAPGHAAILARYRLRNLGTRDRRDTLALAVRAIALVPARSAPSPGPVSALGRDGRVVRTSAGRGFECLDPPGAFGAATFDQGDVVDWLGAGTLPRSERMPDPTGRGSGAVWWPLDVPAGTEREVVLLLPLHEPPVEPPMPGDRATVATYADAIEHLARAKWRARLDSVSVRPADAQVARAFTAQRAWLCVLGDRSPARDGAIAAAGEAAGPPATPDVMAGAQDAAVARAYVGAVLACVAREDDADSALVLGAGVPEAWLTGPGLEVRGVRTRWGALAYSATRRAGGELVVRIGGEALRVPPGGLRLALPGVPPSAARVRALPAELHFGGAAAPARANSTPRGDSRPQPR